VFDRPQELEVFKAKVNETGKHLTSVRKILDLYNYARRGSMINDVIREHLREVGLKATPDFEAIWIDAPLYLVEDTVDSKTNTEEPKKPETEPSDVETVSPSHRISRLKAANTNVVAVAMSDSLQKAITLMLQHDFSQLPIMQGTRNPKGMISWKSIGRNTMLGKTCNAVQDCLEPHHEVSLKASIMEVIPIITEHDCVLIRDDKNEISGIVTAADLAEQFQTLSEPFLVLGDIESRLRRLIDHHYTTEELQESRDPNDESRTVESASDLTFGEYKRLLEKPERWSKAQLNLDRKMFIDALDNVRLIRNDVMHFDPDGLADEKLKQLREFNQLLACVIEAKDLH
jgi:predicted transcriptional regulator